MVQTPAKKRTQNETSNTNTTPLMKKGRVDRTDVKGATQMTREEFLKCQVGMDAQWPLPGYMQGMKGHTQYKEETYQIVTRWTADTPIAYRPHAKAPGSKSHLRYEQYSKATTVGEALSLGSYPVDWCWDYERGFIKVLGGPIREEPLDISKGEESQVTDVDRAINTWYQRELAKMLGMKVSDISASAGWGESVHIRALRLLAQKEAKERLEAADAEGRAITDDEVLMTLKRWPFFRNPWRKNVMQPGKTWVFSDTLGLLRDRQGDVHLTAPTRRYPQVTELLARWLTDRLPKDVKSFRFTSMNVNCNYAASLHRDNGNFGPSFIKAFGDFSGGQLQYWPEDAGGDLKELDKDGCVSMDLQKNLVLFNGNCAHSVEDFMGSRYSIVYFTVGCHAAIEQKDREQLQRLGFPYPSVDADPFELLRRPRGKGGMGGTPGKDHGSCPAYRSLEAAALPRNCQRRPMSVEEVKKITEGRVQPENARSFYATDQRRIRKGYDTPAANEASAKDDEANIEFS